MALSLHEAIVSTGFKYVLQPTCGVNLTQLYRSFSTRHLVLEVAVWEQLGCCTHTQCCLTRTKAGGGEDYWAWVANLLRQVERTCCIHILPTLHCSWFGHTS